MEINELIEKKLPSLPSPVRDILSDSSNLTIVQRLGEAHGLDEISQEMLAEEVALVLIREQSIDKFKDNLVWNLLMTEKKAESLFNELDNSIFLPVKKFLIKDIPATTPKTNTPQLENESLSHNDILKEIEDPIASITPVDTKAIPAVSVMPKEAQILMTKEDTLPTETTPAPQLQDAVTQLIPNVGGFIPLSDTLKPTQNINERMGNKLSTIVKTPTKELYVPKNPDPYREPIV